jgi:hypothetical protein
MRSPIPCWARVVFAPSLELDRTHLDAGIYRIDADGGVPKLLVEPTSRYLPDQDRTFRTGLYFPTFSPDGTQIAFFDGLRRQQPQPARGQRRRE